MFISYAQNLEDVILWRAFKHIENGFYIDIGAQDPVIDSVSRGFYEKGWRGIHAEPTAIYADKLRQNRPDEQVFQMAIGRGDDSIRFFEIPETGLSTGDPEIATMHRTAGLKVIENEVPIKPLSVLFESVEARDVHWLKIDVEGMEKSVLESWMPSTVRPWVVVIESTVPNSQEPSYKDWQNTILALGYKFVYFDGLSRYYLSVDHLELRKYFKVCPNIFDNYTISGTAKTSVPYMLNNKIDELLSENEQLRSEIHKVREKIDEATIELKDMKGNLIEEKDKTAHWQSYAEQLQAEIQAIHSSFSWRATYPMRLIIKAFRS